MSQLCTLWRNWLWASVWKIISKLLVYPARWEGVLFLHTWSLRPSHQRVYSNCVIYERGLGPDYLHLTSGGTEDWVTKAGYLDAPSCMTDSQWKGHMPRPQGAFRVDSTLYVHSFPLLGELGAICRISAGEDNWKLHLGFSWNFRSRTEWFITSGQHPVVTTSALLGPRSPG